MNILATSAAFRPARREGMRPSPVVEYAIELAEVSGRRPKVCAMHTALGDDSRWIAMTYAAFAGHRPDVELSHLALFPMPNVEDPRAHLLEQDVVWVGGGSVANLLAVWRVHGLDEVFREAWEAGVVLTGVSAGSLCWHVGGTTDSYGPDLRLVTNGLGLLPYSNTPHYDSEEQRRPLVPEPGCERRAARRLRDRRRGRRALPRHRVRRGRLRPARRLRLARRTRGQRRRRRGARDAHHPAPARPAVAWRGAGTPARDHRIRAGVGLSA